MIVYFDTSALVKGYVQEAGSSEVLELLDNEGNSFGSAVVTQVEMASAIQRAIQTIGVSTIPAKAWQDFLDDWSGFNLIEISPVLIERACQVAWEHKLRGYDSLHLAAALLWQESLGEQVTLATFDRDLWTAGRKLGMEVWPEGLVLDV
jgi:predicted nucleic acid-binding protein